jgi:DNA (cytosine-5)-methyltransferase 1
MRYLSVCSGIEAATVAWHDMGWQAAAYSEIEKFPSEVLKYHYPSVPNMGDMTKYKEWEIGTIGLLVGGTPCQSFSVAGLRKGLEDPRGNLALTYVGILDKFRPKWFIWENVPGVLSSGKGRDFGSFLGAVVELGYGFSYRVLDAQHFGVAQRRRRVFVVGHLGDWRPTAKVLFESESLCRNTKQSKKKREATTTTFVPSIANCLQTTSNDYSRADGFNMISTRITGPLTARDYKGISAYDCNPEMAKMVAQVYENHGTDSRIKPIEISPTVTARWGTGGNNVPLAHAFKVRGGCAGGGKGYLGQDEKAFTISTMQDQQIFQNMAVRRLTEIECERLQGFPDNYTNIKENCPSGARYKALGNSMAVPVMKWIGKRIQMVEDGLI